MVKLVKKCLKFMNKIFIIRFLKENYLSLALFLSRMLRNSNCYLYVFFLEIKIIGKCFNARLKDRCILLLRIGCRYRF